MTLRNVSIVIALLLLARQAQASPIFYSEAVSGDLAEASPHTFLLDVGANKVSGSISGDPSGSPDIDRFNFVVPSGMQLNSIVFDYVSTGATSLNVFAALNDQTPVPGTLMGQRTINVSGSGSTPFMGNLLPLAPDTYQLLLGGALGFNGTSLVTNYTWTLEVTSLPEPASMLLLGTGLVGLAGVRYRRHRP